MKIPLICATGPPVRMKHLLTSIALTCLLTACVTGERYMLDDGETVVLGDTTDCVDGVCTDPALEPLIDYADPEPTEEQKQITRSNS